MHMRSFTIILNSKTALVEMEDTNGVNVKFHPLLTPDLRAAVNIFCNDQYKKWKEAA